LNIKEVTFIDYLLYALTFFVVVISFYSNLIIGLISSAFLVFGYGSYMLYQSLFYGKVSIGNSYFWIILFPLSAFISGRLSDSVNEVRDRNIKFENQVNNLVTIDETTGFDNLKEFYKDLNEEMSRSRRHKFSLVVMLAEIQYLDELASIYGKYNMSKIFKVMSDLIEKVTRTEDKKYRIDDDLFAVIMPNTDIPGAEVVKGRLRKELENITIDNNTGAKRYKFDIKIALVQYNEKITNALEFKELVQKELEYDI